jgi:hypothetical protein
MRHSTDGLREAEGVAEGSPRIPEHTETGIFWSQVLQEKNAKNLLLP